MLLTLVGLTCLAWPTFAAADKSDCESLESALRFAAEDFGWTTEQVDAYVQNGAASCWEEVKAEEAAQAAQDAEVRAAQEKEAEEAATKQAQERKEAREAHAIEREEVREARRRQREWAHKPTVTKPTAEEFAKRLMRKTSYSIWEVDCDGGRLNRTHWSCKVSIFYHCLRGRIQIFGEGYKDGRRWFGARGGKLRQCQI